MGAFRHIPGLWLDATRLLSRVGRDVLTGIDRVELAYLREGLASGCRHYLCRTTRGYLLLDQRGAEHLIAMAVGEVAPGPADRLSRLTFRGARPRHRAEATLRALAMDRCGAAGLARLLARHRTPDRTFIGVGHANLTETTLRALARPTGSRLAIMVHDLIPVTHPECVRPEQPAAFAARLESVRRHATHVIANSVATEGALSTHWGARGGPDRIVAPLGLARRSAPPAIRERGNFVMLGTIEPRKNHAMIVDVWEMLAAELAPGDMPHLHIIGAVGWRVECLVDRLRSHPLMGKSIFLHGPLPDRRVAEHLARATALLFPSLAEGYGYPPLEAALAGAVPICSRLPVFDETLGDCALYVARPDPLLWKETIRQHLAGKTALPDLAELRVPTWQEHFETVASAITARTGRGRP